MVVHVTRTHSLGAHAVRRRVEDIARDLSRDLRVRYTWEGDQLIFHRRGAKGHISIDEEAVHVTVKTSRLLPVSDSWLRAEVEKLLDEHLTPVSP